MTEQRKQELLKLAKGSWQYSILKNLLTGKEITSPPSQLQGKAKSYSGKYKSSFTSLLSRIEKAGLTIQRTPGIRGGEWTATYKIAV